LPLTLSETRAARLERLLSGDVGKHVVLGSRLFTDAALSVVEAERTMTTAKIANPMADPRPLTVCDRCGSTDWQDVDCGEYTIRRECSDPNCRRFMGWPKWRNLDLGTVAQSLNYQREQARQERVARIMGDAGGKVKPAAAMLFNYQQATAIASCVPTDSGSSCSIGERCSFPQGVPATLTTSRPTSVPHGRGTPSRSSATVSHCRSRKLHTVRLSTP
jgi:hypothetical protein